MPDFEFYLSGTAIRTSPTDKYIDDFEVMYNDFESNAPNYYSEDDDDAIEEEVTFGTKVFTPVSVRVDSFIDPSTGKNVGDDYKTFIFSPSLAKQFIGKLFKWKNNYWLAIDTNTYESLANGCLVHRCNNVLRWIDRNGITKTEPCILSYDLLRTGNNPNKDTVLTSGEIYSFSQKNADTNYIYGNDRFLFGTPQNRSAYKVGGNGVQNFLNQQTEAENGVGVLQLKMNADYVNKETDNIELGIADANINLYQISISQDTVYGTVGLTTQLSAKVYKDGILVTKDIVWASDDTDVFTVNASGLVTCVGVGSAKVSVVLLDNPNIKDEKDVIVSSVIVEDYDIRINPYVSSIYEGTTETFTCELYLNEVATLDTFTFEVLGTVPTTYYNFTEIDANTFSIKNIKMYLNQQIPSESDIIVRCVSGIHQKDFSFRLKGVF